MTLPVRARRIDHVQRQIRFGHFFQRGAERGDQGMRQSIDESDRIGDEQLALIAELDLPDERIERHEQRVGRHGVLVRHAVEQRGLAGVGVADERDGRDRALLPPLPELRPALAHLIDLTLNRLDADANTTTIGFEFRFTGATRADAATEARQCRPAPGEARKQVLELRELDLPLALTRARAAREDVENQLRPIDDLALEFLLELTKLSRRELVVEDHEVHVSLGAGGSQTRDLPGYR